MSDRQDGSQILIGESEAVQALKRALHSLASAPTLGVVLRGEPGSGKRTFARALHVATREATEMLEPRHPKEVEAALKHGGPATVYLGELRAMPSALKARISYMLYERRTPANVRFMAAVSTHGVPSARAGDVLPSLLHRFGLTLDIPPLRERPDDLPLLAQHLMARLAAERGLQRAELSPEVLGALRVERWPGNVRQLENALHRAMLLANGAALEVAHLGGNAPATRYELPVDGLDLNALERDLLVQALRRSRGNRTHAGILLGLTRDQVRYRLAKLALNDEV